MNSCFRKNGNRRRAIALMLVVGAMGMLGATAVLLSAHFTTLYRHVRLQTDKAQARQLSASGLQWALQNLPQILDQEKPQTTLPVPEGVRATLTVIRAEDKSVLTVEAVVRRASHSVVHRRHLPVRASTQPAEP